LHRDRRRRRGTREAEDTDDEDSREEGTSERPTDEFENEPGLERLAQVQTSFRRAGGLDMPAHVDHERKDRPTEENTVRIRTIPSHDDGDDDDESDLEKEPE
jgi:hypothetical protein